MKGQYLRPSELLKLLKETGLSYWDIIGNPLPTFDSGADDVESLSPHPYTAKQIEVLLPFERFRGGKPSASKFLMASIGSRSGAIDNLIDWYTKKGYSPTQIAGILGNIAQESLFDENIIGAGKAYGLYQMSPTMRKNARIYAKKLGKEYSDSAWVDAVLRGDKNLPGAWSTYGFEKGPGYLQRKYKNAGEAAKAFHDIFERAGIPDMNERIRSANDAYSYIMRRRLNGQIDNELNLKPDATRVDRPIIVTSQLRKPLQKELPLVVQEEPEEQAVLIPELLPSILPNPINWFNLAFGEDLPTFLHGKSGIHIKPSHRGRFTRYLKAHPGMTASKAKHSKSAAVRRMATFALNARKWKH